MIFLEYIESILNNFYFIFFANLSSFILKACILILLIIKSFFPFKIERPLFFLLLIIISNMFSDFAWIIKLWQMLFFPQLNYQVTLFITRIAWIFAITQYQTIALFLESLVVQKYQIPLRQKICCFLSILLCSFYIFILLLNFDCIDSSQRIFFVVTIQNSLILYAMFLLAVPSLFIVIQTIRKGILPLILRKQLFILINGLIIPVLVADFIQVCPFKIRALETLAHNYIAVSFTTIFLTLAIYFCARKIFGRQTG